jgi:hypothetical protein
MMSRGFYVRYLLQPEFMFVHSAELSKGVVTLSHLIAYELKLYHRLYHDISQAHVVGMNEWLWFHSSNWVLRDISGAMDG